VLDVWSRRIVGWSMATHLRAELVVSALDMALAQRRPRSVIHHSDRGCQYTSYAFGKRCREMGVMPSVGSVGDAYDNAMAESFFATIEREVLNRRRFKTQAEARMAIFEWRILLSIGTHWAYPLIFFEDGECQWTSDFLVIMEFGTRREWLGRII
jgi:putative transposase